jgi:hypothetical protein
MHKEYTDKELLNISNECIDEKLILNGKAYGYARLIPDLIKEILQLREIIEEHHQLSMERDLSN